MTEKYPRIVGIFFAKKITPRNKLGRLLYRSLCVTEEGFACIGERRSAGGSGKLHSPGRLSPHRRDFRYPWQSEWESFRASTPRGGA